MSRKKILIIISLLGLFFLVLFLLFLASRPQKLPPPPFKLLTTEPQLTPDYLYAPGLQITFLFNQPLSPEAFSYSLQPDFPATVKSTVEGRGIILSPIERWPEGNFSLTVLKKTTSLAGEKLDQDYFYQTQVGFDASGAY